MHTPATPPIKSIWYNSQAKLEEQYYRYERRIPYDRTYDPGWFDLLLAGYNGILNSNNEICFNADFKPQPEHFVTLVCNGSVSARTDMTLRKGQFLFNILGPSYDKELMKDGLAFIEVLKRTSERERDRVVHTDARLSGKRGGTGFQSLGQSPTSDYSPKNRSSVAFNAVDKDDPATRVLMLGDAALASEVNAGKYNIMKIAHHGSGHNNYLSSREWTMNHEVKIKVSESVLKQSFAFFYKMIAKKYVISASPDTGSPNPHIATILGIFFAVLERRLKNPKSTEVVDIYLTNELPLITKTTIEAFLTDPEGAKYPNPDGGLDVHVLAKGNDNATLTLLHSFSGYVRLFLLKPNLAYGTIGIYDDDPDLAYWKEYADKDFHKPKVTAASSATSVSNKKRNLTSPLPGGASTSKRKPGS
ncbi:hypothetical protein C8J56DRAFT_271081 [Mycena floridula]|nr:hypothetical protein C8J56DRAFT_271081 [Mycena floridula]